MVTIPDDKSTHCIPFILTRLRMHQSQAAPEEDRPFFIGLNGVQGAGKTTLVRALATTLREQEQLETLVLSIDDLYLTHADQQALAARHPDNPLVQHRGEPGTHDTQLARDLFAALQTSAPTRVPQYDKSAFAGRGDRVPAARWAHVNRPAQPRVQVVILEGWCVGFRALGPEAVARKRERSVAAGSGALGKHRLEHLLFVNERLRDYDVMTDVLDAFIHLDAEETAYVYGWRREQEEALRRERGTGMTDEEVVRFVDGYYPAYELFTEELRAGVFKGHEAEGRQLRLVVRKDRTVKGAILI